MKPQNFTYLAGLLHSGSGLSIGPENTYRLHTGLAALMRDAGIASLDALAEQLQSRPSPQLAAQVIEAMTIHETRFFRDESCFEHLATHALPRLMAARPQGAKLRIWSAASSYGQEAYSVAMLLAGQQARWQNRPAEIVGTDVARDAVLRAQLGLYSTFEVQRGLPPALQREYFQQTPEGWRIAPALRAMVRFQTWNLLHDLAPLGQFDVILCRNVLIYFDAPTKSRVLDALADRLQPDGVLYLGGAETVLGLTRKLVSLTGNPATFGRSDSQGPAPPRTTPAPKRNAATQQVVTFTGS